MRWYSRSTFATSTCLPRWWRVLTINYRWYCFLPDQREASSEIRWSVPEYRWNAAFCGPGTGWEQLLAKTRREILMRRGRSAIGDLMHLEIYWSGCTANASSSKLISERGFPGFRGSEVRYLQVCDASWLNDFERWHYVLPNLFQFKVKIVLAPTKALVSSSTQNIGSTYDLVLKPAEEWPTLQLLD